MDGKRKSAAENRRPSKSIFDEDEEDSEEEVIKVRKRTNSRISSESSQSASTLSKEYVSRGIQNLSESSSSDESEDEPPKKRLSDVNCSKISQIANLESDDSNDNEKVSEYFDFSEIISTQQKIKDLESNKSDDVPTSVITKKTQGFCLSETTCKRNRRTKNKLTPQKKSCKDDKATEDPNKQIEVSELLAMGESNKTETDQFSDDQGDENLPTTSEDVKRDIQVKIELPNIMLQKKKKKFDVDAALKRRLNAIKRENQVFLHKVHLLCLIAHWNMVDEILNSETLLGSALSIVPSEKFYPPKLATLDYLEKLVKWFTKKVEIIDKPRKNDMFLKESLLIQFSQCKANTLKDKVMMFVCIARVLGLKCRIIVNLQPTPLRPSRDDLIPINSKKDEKQSESEDNESSEDEFTEVVASESKMPKGKVKKSNNSEYFDDKTSKGSNKNKKTLSKCETPNSKKNTRSSASNKSVKTGSKSSTSKASTSKTKQKVKDRRLLSSDTDDDLVMTKKKKKIGNDIWSEVFLESEEKWISVDINLGKIHCVDKLQSQCSQPICYVMGWNGDHTFKDLTKRYSSQWMTKTRKLRIENVWWDETIRPWKPRRTAREKEEDYQLDKTLEDMPLPATISEFKNHPLYVLKRHLLKFESIYPADAPPLGYVKGEPIYSRLCVSDLHSRETWLRQAKSVRVNEKAYKIVKSRPKYDKLTGQIVSDLPLEIFGHWQVEDYQPPVAVNGVVPRNDYGNVELYKPSMLPIGTVHLQIPGLLRVARKLKIDCAPALVGWEYNQGCSFPVLDGFVVCEEFKDVLLDNWNKAIDESAKKEKEKTEQRVYGNWRKLIKGLIIRERLEKKYNFGPVNEPKAKRKPVKRKNNKK